MSELATMPGPTEAIAAEIHLMRGEARRRSVLLCLIALIIPSLILGSTWTPELYDLILPLGPPVSSLLHAFLLLLILTLGVIALSEVRTARLLLKGRPLLQSGTVVVAELASRTGVDAQAQVFGPLNEEGIEAVVAGRLAVIRVGTLWVRKSIFAPDHFRFAIAHELAHLASGDPRAKRIIEAAVLVGGLAMAAAIVRVIAYVAGDSLALSRLDFPTLVFVMKNAIPAVIANLVAFGTLGLLLFLEGRASARLREFHADAIAHHLSGSKEAFATVSGHAPEGALAGLVNRLLALHPPTRQRILALKQAETAFRADELLFVLAGYFSSTILEISLQLNFVMATPGVSTLAQRRTHLSEAIADNPVTYISIIGAAAGLLMLSHSLILGRMLMSSERRGRLGRTIGQASRLLGLAALGGLIALATSQTVYFELSDGGWNLLRWVARDPDRISLHACLTATLGIVAFAASTSPWLRNQKSINAVLAIVPAAATLAVALCFYG